ncbi:MAG: hypothetical protein QNI91_18550 [Arenicellales bacterium]|nr:hypothetical protein [Arenicellales bacterium]
MLESLSVSLANNFLWIAACILVVTIAKIGIDIFEKRSTRRILEDAESLEREKEDELRRRIEQASRRLALNGDNEGLGLVPNRRLLH